MGNRALSQTFDLEHCSTGVRMYKQTGMRKLRPMASRDIYQSSQIVLNIQIHGP